MRRGRRLDLAVATPVAVAADDLLVLVIPQCVQGAVLAGVLVVLVIYLFLGNASAQERYGSQVLPRMSAQ